ncbi:hypothetical protein MGSAQ_001790 [marine sediment metagenome]|uniref:Uncharacterized protein n=1 Tax=marine sediment metagenome TaxID=412755 RepID=A0A1B6NTM9_9ZZZZ
MAIFVKLKITFQIKKNKGMSLRCENSVPATKHSILCG